MKNTLFISIIFIVTILTACKSSKKAESSAENNSETLKLENVKEMVIDKAFKPDSIDYAISNVVLNGNILSMDVNYNGGCGKHNFDLYFNGNYAKSKPVQAGLFLKHIKENETCKQEISESLKFDISKVQYQGQKTVVFKVKSIKESFEYNY